jgi:hypothetical protein
MDEAEKKPELSYVIVGFKDGHHSIHASGDGHDGPFPLDYLYKNALIGKTLRVYHKGRRGRSAFCSRSSQF